MMYKIDLTHIPTCIHLYANAKSRRVYVDAHYLSPSYSLHIRKHSLHGYAWGFNGSGPAQLALAIMLHFVNVEVATLLYQDFKRLYVATWPADSNVNLYLNMQSIISDLLQQSTANNIVEAL